MSLLTDGDLAAMRTTLELSLPGTAFILRRSQAADGQGGSTDTFGTAGTAACRLSPRSVMRAGDEEIRGDRVAGVNERIVTLPTGTTVLTTDRLVIGTQTFEVTAVHEPRSYQLAVRVDAVQVA